MVVSEDNSITSLRFSQSAQSILAVGTKVKSEFTETELILGQIAAVELWDTESLKQIRVMAVHTGRVGVLAWNESTHSVLSSGSAVSLLSE